MACATIAALASARQPPFSRHVCADRLIGEAAWRSAVRAFECSRPSNRLSYAEMIEINFGFELVVGAIKTLIGLASAGIIERTVKTKLTCILEVNPEASQIGRVGTDPHQDRHDQADDAGVVGEHSRGARHAEAKLLTVDVLGKRNLRRESVGAADRADTHQRSRDRKLPLAHAQRDIEDRPMVDAARIIVEDELDRGARLDLWKPFGENIPISVSSSVMMKDITERACVVRSPSASAIATTI
jgi:hypothetical protein